MRPRHGCDPLRVSAVQEAKRHVLPHSKALMPPIDVPEGFVDLASHAASIADSICRLTRLGSSISSLALSANAFHFPMPRPSSIQQTPLCLICVSVPLQRPSIVWWFGPHSPHRPPRHRRPPYHPRRCQVSCHAWRAQQPTLQSTSPSVAQPSRTLVPR